MTVMNRRAFVTTVAGAALACGLPALAATSSDATTAARMQAAQDALASWRTAFELWQACENPFYVVEVSTGTSIWEKFVPTPPTRTYNAVRDRARDAVEAVFMTSPQTEDDELMVMRALELYREVAPSAFAVQTARDLFTPKRFQTYPHDRDRDWLLNEPEEAFAKSPVPDFLWRVRAEHRRGRCGWA